MNNIDFNKRYERADFVSFLQQVFLPEDFSPAAEALPLEFKPKYIDNVIHLGECPVMKLNVYEIKHGSEHDPRVSLTKEAFRLMKGYNDRNALAVFISPKSDNYRFSYITMGLKAEDTKVTYEYSNPRRYSYFLGPEARVNTPERFLVKKPRVVDMEDLQERFSVEVVNEEFYREIAMLFTKLVGGKRKEGSKTKEFEAILRLPSVTDRQKMQEFAVRMIGRIIFCWFLKKKTTSDGKPLIPDEILSLNAVIKHDNYYHTILEKLFFQVLNTPQNKRQLRSEDDIKRFVTIPFLNGGLFEPSPKDDFYDYNEINDLTGESKMFYIRIVDDVWMKELFTLLETYNFTIDENTSMDVELSVDPEMLGRIFENLLAEINPETGETARKSTGSYYTPRPTVEYMVDESLKQYLLTKTGIEEKKLQRLLAFSEDVEDLELSRDEKDQIINAMDTVKIIDPACGSGAFPMGILQKIVLVLQKVDPDSKEWRNKLLVSIPDPIVQQAIRKKLENEKDLWNYTRKLGVIKKSIYGIDIQPIAVEISKLRTFLSLVVEEKIDDSKPNLGIESLPNLEFKFVCANSLVRLPEHGKNKGPLISNEDPFFEQLGKEIDVYFSLSDPDKKTLSRKTIEQLIDERVMEKVRKIKDMETFHSDNRFSKIYKKKKQKIIREEVFESELWESYKNIFKNKEVKFFDTKYFFPEIKGGFDIVIANPPYGFHKIHSDEMKRYFKTNYISSKGSFEHYFLFYEASLMLIKDFGCHTFIAPVTWLTIPSALSLRKYILDNFQIKEILWVSEMIFKSAKVNTLISLIRKAQKGKVVIKIVEKGSTISELCERRVMNQDYFIENDYYISIFLNLEDINIMEKLKRDSMPLKEIAKPCSGYNPYEVGKGTAPSGGPHTQETIVEKPYHSSCKKSKEYKPEIIGRNISRYYIEIKGDRWIKYGKWLAAPREEENFQGKRILVQEITGGIAKRIIASLCENELYYSRDVIPIKIINDYPSPLFLLGIINSRLMTYYHHKNSPKSKKGLFPKILVSDLEKLPIKKVNISSPEKGIYKKITKSVDLMLDAQTRYHSYKSATEKETLTKTIGILDDEIDRLVYQLYNLTPEEIAIVEENTR